MNHTLDNENDVFYNLALITTEIESQLKADELEYMRMHLHAQIRNMENPEVMRSLTTITIFEKIEHADKTSTTKYINYIKDENGAWSIQTGERFSEIKNSITYTKDETITYYLGRHKVLSPQEITLTADVSTARIIEHCFQERESLLTTTFAFENGEWKEKMTRRNSAYRDTVTQHVDDSRKRIRI